MVFLAEGGCAVVLLAKHKGSVPAVLRKDGAWPSQRFSRFLAIFEVGILYSATFNLESATAQGVRLIRTAQVQNQNFDAGKFKTEVCKRITAPITCAGLRLDVRRYSSFGGAGSDLTKSARRQRQSQDQFRLRPGRQGDVVVVRAFYEWPLVAKLPKPISLANMQNGDRLRVATTAFRNEPFQPPQ